MTKTFLLPGSYQELILAYQRTLFFQIDLCLQKRNCGHLKWKHFFHYCSVSSEIAAIDPEMLELAQLTELNIKPQQQSVAVSFKGKKCIPVNPALFLMFFLTR